MRYCVDPSRFYVVTFFRQSTKLPKDLNGFEPLFYKIQLYALVHYATSLTIGKMGFEPIPANIEGLHKIFLFFNYRFTITFREYKLALACTVSVLYRQH